MGEFLRRHVPARGSSRSWLPPSTCRPRRRRRRRRSSRSASSSIRASGRGKSRRSATTRGGNHCALARGTASPDPKQGEPKFLLLVDKGDDDPAACARAEYKFTRGKRRSPSRRSPRRAWRASRSPQPAGRTSPTSASSAEPTERDALLSTKYLDIRTGDATVRLSFEGLDEARPAFKQCLANIGSPAKGWSDAEFEQILEQVKRGKTKCATRKNVTTCDVD
jgi:hypothetical protein